MAVTWLRAAVEQCSPSGLSLLAVAALPPCCASAGVRMAPLVGRCDLLEMHKRFSCGLGVVLLRLFTLRWLSG